MTFLGKQLCGEGVYRPKGLKARKQFRPNGLLQGSTSMHTMVALCGNSTFTAGSMRTS